MRLAMHMHTPTNMQLVCLGLPFSGPGEHWPAYMHDKSERTNMADMQVCADCA